MVSNSVHDLACSLISISMPSLLHAEKSERPDRFNDVISVVWDVHVQMFSLYMYMFVTLKEDEPDRDSLTLE